MDWLQVAVHVWFGSAITANLVFVRALMRLPIACQADRIRRRTPPASS